MNASRRDLLKSAAMAATLSALPLGVRLSFAATPAASSQIIVFVLLRGGMDGLNLVAPSDDPNLIAARPAGLLLASSGTNVALPLANGPSNNDWRLHPSAPELKQLYDAGHLAVVHASGVPADSRSHFQMQSMLEHGVADPTQIGTTGWIGRYATDTGIASSTFALISSSDTLPPSMTGDPGAVSMPDPKQFGLGSVDRSKFVQAAYGGATGLIGNASRTAINAVNSFANLSGSFTPPPAGTYANDAFGKGLSVIAEIVKLNIGLRVAEVEYNSVWDTHVNQQPRFAAAVTVLSKGLGAFYNDLSAYANSITMIAVSEFGRRMQSNANQGTDHGHGNAMLVLGGAVNGGRIYGQWPGLGRSVLSLGDVPITTDYRSVLSEVVTATRGDLPVGLFPGFTPGQPLGLIGGGA